MDHFFYCSPIPLPLICGFIDNNGKIDTSIDVTRYICTVVHTWKWNQEFSGDSPKDDPLQVISLWPSANSHNLCCLQYVVHGSFVYNHDHCVIIWSGSNPPRHWTLNTAGSTLRSIQTWNMLRSMNNHGNRMGKTLSKMLLGALVYRH